MHFNYPYDDQGQLTDDGTNTYDYDLNGNRDTDSTVGDDNRLEDDGTWEYSYDDEGNLTAKTDGTITWSYGYDHHNHLISAEKEVSGTGVVLTADYHYDAFDNRIEKAVDADGAGSNPAEILRFAQDGWNTLKPSPIGNENWDVWGDLDGANALMARYLRGDQVDELLGRVEDVSSTLTPYWYLKDNLGSVRDIQSDAGTWESVGYDSFGNILEEASTRGRYSWTGREFDTETELQYNRARFYDGTTGRWISQDPMGFDAGDSNLYRYVHNNPVQLLDPSGKQEGDDRDIAPGNESLKNIEKDIEGRFNNGINIYYNVYQAKVKQAGPESLLRYAREYLAKIYDIYGKNTSDSGITILNVSKLTGTEVLLNQLLKRKEQINHISFKNSRYGNVPLGLNLDAPALYWTKDDNILDHAISPTIMINDDLMSTDKLGHFFQQGFWLWDQINNGDFKQSDLTNYSKWLEGDPKAPK